MTPEEIRAAIADNPKMRPRDLADSLGLGEAALVAAGGATVIKAHPDDIMPRLASVGPLMALTRNASAVHEKTGCYENYRSGAHACMVLADKIDLRIFPSHWVHGFVVETDKHTSLQIFDAAGDAVHKIYTRDAMDMDAWNAMTRELRLETHSEALDLVAREPVEKPKSNPAKADILREEWAKITDTHQFMRLTSKLKMNRLGAYRVVGAPFAQKLSEEAFDLALQALAGSDIHLMLFVGNRGCIQIHSGPIHKLKEMGPWQNVLDPDFNLHLRRDHIKEVWCVDKPTKRGMTRSIECFDADGALIAQMFGARNDALNHTAPFSEVIDNLPRFSE